MLDLYCPASVYTGCAVTPCNAHFQASWRSPDIDIGAGGCFQRRWGALLVHSYVKSLPPFRHWQMPRGEGALPHGLASASICKTAWVRQRSLLLNKQVFKRYKRFIDY
jgi:hypothetical protein